MAWSLASVEREAARYRQEAENLRWRAEHVGYLDDAQRESLRRSARGWDVEAALWEAEAERRRSPVS